MKPFWRYGRPGKERLIVEAFEAVKDSFSWEDEEAAKIAVHKWLMDKGYFKGSNKQKSRKFKDPGFFWSKKNYDKYVALLRALLNQEFYTEMEEEDKAYRNALEQQIAEATAIEKEKFDKKYPEYAMQPGQIADSWKEEFTGSFGSWALRASVAYAGGVLVLNAFKGTKK